MRLRRDVMMELQRQRFTEVIETNQKALTLDGGQGSAVSICPKVLLSDPLPLVC